PGGRCWRSDCVMTSGSSADRTQRCVGIPSRRRRHSLFFDLPDKHAFCLFLQLVSIDLQPVLFAASTTAIVKSPRNPTQSPKNLRPYLTDPTGLTGSFAAAYLHSPLEEADPRTPQSCSSLVTFPCNGHRSSNPTRFGGIESMARGEAMLLSGWPAWWV